MRTLLIGGALLVAAGAGGAAIASQHTPSTHARQQLCEALHSSHGGQTSGSDHVAFLSEKLELSAAQRESVERVRDEACAAMAKYHEQILAVLTAEQRVRLEELHEGAGGLHGWFRKLHGGR
jgi:Spy/CpxP family protein refolding chaperone